MNNLAKKMLESGMTLTAPQVKTIKITSIFSHHSSSEKEDIKWFKDNKPDKRYAFIREAHYQEFETNFSLHEYSKIPKLWVLVTYESANHIKKVPIYRGNCPYAEIPQSDEAVFFIVEHCINMGGIEVEAIEKWLTEKFNIHSSSNA
jgi:hypothetical protein